MDASCLVSNMGGNNRSAGNGNRGTGKGSHGSGNGNRGSSKGNRGTAKGNRGTGKGNRGKGKGKGQGSSKKVTKQQRRAEEMALVASQALTALRASDLAGCVRILCDQGAAFRPFLEDLRKDLPSAPVQSQLMQMLREEGKLGMAAELIAAIGQEHADELVPLLHAMLDGEVDMITAVRIILEPENKHHVRNCVLTVLLPHRCITAV